MIRPFLYINPRAEFSQGISLQDLQNNLVLFIILVSVWTFAAVTSVRDRRACDLEESDYLIGDLLHQDQYVRLMHQVMDADHPVHKGATHQTHQMLKRPSPTSESLKAAMEELIGSLDEVRNPFRSYWSYIIHDNAVCSAFNPYNWAASQHFRKQGLMILAKIITFLFVLCVNTDATSYVCALLEEATHDTDDDPEVDPNKPILDMINSFEDPDLSIPNKIAELIFMVIGEIFTILYNTMWAFPMMFLIMAEDSLGDMVDETDKLMITRMMELADTDIWHGANIEELDDAKLAEQMLEVLLHTLERQAEYANKERELGAHLRQVLSKYSAKASLDTVQHLLHPSTDQLHGEGSRDR